ncbi:MAG: hypothetical protein K1Y02_11585 [Candidatus Hydrogenedentes bacterium]|nr:hypothetical protein [Candidatus Hydrogenedentota bacterium]
MSRVIKSISVTLAVCASCIEASAQVSPIITILEVGPTAPNPPSSSPMYLTACGDYVYFSADDGENGRELWSVDVSDRCQLSVDLEDGAKGSSPKVLKDMGGGVLFFSAEVTSNGFGREAYLRESEASELALLGDLAPGNLSSDPEPSARAGSWIVFNASPNLNQRNVFVTQASGRPCFKVEIPASTGQFFTALLGDDRILVASRNLLYAFQPESREVSLISDGRGGTSIIDHLVSLGSRALFRYQDDACGSELWVTDGTQEGTRLLKDVRPGPASSEMGSMTVIGDVAWFQANDGEHGNELWVTDGTAEGTVMVKDVCPGAGGSDPHYFEKAGDYVYFFANDGQHGIEVWRTDGTNAGTQLLVDLFPGSVGSEPWSPEEFRGKLYFCANSIEFGEEVFCTDGTAQGTTPLADIVPGTGSSGPDSLTNLKEERLFFTCNDGVHGEELWGSDGSAAGTRLVADIWKHASQKSPSASPHDLAIVNGRLCFGATSRECGDELWRSDGTTEGTQIVTDIRAGSEDSRPELLANLGTVLLFSAEDETSGRELWRTDGTAEGTVRVKDIWAGKQGSCPRMGVASRGKVYFVAEASPNAPRLWETDGTEEGTSILAHQPETEAGAAIEEVFVLREHIFIYTSGESSMSALWVLDEDGTLRKLYMANPLVDMAVLLGQAKTEPTQWEQKIEGLPVPLISAIHPPGSKRSLCPFVDIGGVVLFAAHTFETGAELWSTDGTPNGTRLVSDCFPGQASSSPSLLAASPTELLFVAHHPQYGRVVWTSNGTTKGTGVITLVDRAGHAGFPVVASEGRFLDDNAAVFSGSIMPDATFDRELLVIDRRVGNNDLRARGRLAENQSARVHSITPMGDVVFFVADDGIAGEELWKASLVDNRCSMVRDIYPYMDSKVSE